MSGQQQRSGSRRSKSRGNNRRRGKSNANKGPDFWGDASKLPSAEGSVRIAADPSAVVRSLGRAPLQGHETIAAHYFEAVYERAVTLASALAAAGNLIEPEDLLNDHD
jgi:hypothetical protein